MRSLLPVVVLAGFLGVSACLAAGDAPADAPAAGRAPGAVPAAGAVAAATDMRALIAEYASDRQSVRDFYTIDRSPARLTREEFLDAGWAARLDAIDFENLDADARIDWLLLRNLLRHADRRRHATLERLEETAPLLPFATGIIALEEARWRLAPVEPEAAATQLDALAKAIKAAKERAEKGKAQDAAKPGPQGARTDLADEDASEPPLPVAAEGSSEGDGSLGGDGDVVEAGSAPAGASPSVGLLRRERLVAAARRGPEDGPAPAIVSALEWLARHQAEDGSWSAAGVAARCAEHEGPACKDAADPRHDVAITALALRAFLGNGSSDKSGPHHRSVKLACRYLVEVQQPDGSFTAAGKPSSALDHTLATLAMVELYTLTKSHLYLQPVRGSLRHLASLSTSGAAETGSEALMDGPILQGKWAAPALALVALGVAMDQGFAGGEREVHDARAELASRLTEALTDAVASRASTAPATSRLPTIGDHSLERRIAETSAASLALQLAAPQGAPQGAPPIDAQLVKSVLAEVLAARPVAEAERPGLHDPVAWYFGAEALHLAGSWRDPAWSEALNEAASRLQRTEEGARGSFDPRPGPDGELLGRAGTTALLALTLDPPPPAITPVLAQRAAREVAALKRALETWFRHYDEFSPGFAWWARKPYDATIAGLDEYEKLLREELAGLKGKDEDPLVGDPIGRDALVDDLAAEMIDYTPEELLAIGERELAWCEAEMRRASAEMGLGEDWKAALARVKADHVAPGEQDRLVTEQSREAIAFLDAHDLVTIPELCRETWRVRMIDAGTQRTLPYAAYGGQDMLVAYPTRDMDQETKLMTMRGNNVRFSRIVVPHELIPGHHLQGFVASRSNTHRGPFTTPFLGEGWALYWEMRLWELGWARGPEDRIGMLFWRMHRAARILVSLKFHLGQMQPQEMIDLLVERVGHEKAGATSEVRRYIGGGYGPLYQCAYMIGGLQLRALHDELVGAQGGASGGVRGAPGSGGDAGGAMGPATGAHWTERDFHDAVLAQNGIPVKLIRAALGAGGGAAALPREGVAPWRFAGEP
jgi:uncharacterized protein (DUF885 family)